MFGGSHEEMVMSLIKTRQIDPKRIAELSKKLSAHYDKTIKDEEGQ
jgi:hypothetical protein